MRAFPLFVLIGNMVPLPLILFKAIHDLVFILKSRTRKFIQYGHIGKRSKEIQWPAYPLSNFEVLAWGKSKQGRSRCGAIITGSASVSPAGLFDKLKISTGDKFFSGCSQGLSLPFSWHEIPGTQRFKCACFHLLFVMTMLMGPPKLICPNVRNVPISRLQLTDTFYQSWVSRAVITCSYFYCVLLGTLSKSTGS